MMKPKVLEIEEAPNGIPKALVYFTYAANRVGLPALMLGFLAWHMVETERSHRADQQDIYVKIQAMSDNQTNALNRLAEAIELRNLQALRHAATKETN